MFFLLVFVFAFRVVFVFASHSRKLGTKFPETFGTTEFFVIRLRQGYGETGRELLAFALGATAGRPRIKRIWNRDS